ncbi:cobalamin binding intrinsic factor-like isoform 2-T2 [Geothlypis trichas]
MLGVGLGIGVLLALLGCTATEDCVAPQDKVSQLLQRMEESVNFEEAANPSVLLAMNLAGGDSDGPIHKWLLQEIKEEAVRRAQKDMTSGQVALHVLALLSSCQDPQRVHALEQTLDLISVLQQKTDEEMAKLEAEGIPKTTLYSVGLDTLALCLAEAGGAQGPSVALAKQVLNPNRPISVDTQAMVALALACVYDQVELQDVRDLLWETLQTVSNSFLNEQEERNGMIGNIYSMGLALQVGEVPGECGIAATWSHFQMCHSTSHLLHRHWRPQGSFTPHGSGTVPRPSPGCMPMTTSSPWPSPRCCQPWWAGPTWMWLAWTALPPRICPQANSFPCPQCWRPTAFPEVRSSHLESSRPRRDDVPTLWPLRVCQVPTLLRSPCTAPIQVHYCVTNTLQGKHFHDCTSVEVPSGSTLLRVMEEAEKKDSQTFSFQTEQTSWGPYVTSIHGLAGSTEDRTFWKFLSAGNALDEGVGTYKPHDGEHIQAEFSTY